MNKIEVSKATRMQLDWLVAKVLDYDLDMEGAYSPDAGRVVVTALHGSCVPGRNAGETVWHPTSSWEQAGWLLAEMQKKGGVILTIFPGGCQCNYHLPLQVCVEEAQTATEAICKAFVKAELGKLVEVPEEIEMPNFL